MVPWYKPEYNQLNTAHSGRGSKMEAASGDVKQKTHPGLLDCANTGQVLLEYVIRPRTKNLTAVVSRATVS